jgi:hypothetical protein
MLDISCGLSKLQQGEVVLACIPATCCSGKCFEVMCVKRDFKDGYGEHLSRWYACKDENKRVVVKITDRCADA